MGCCATWCVSSMLGLCLARRGRASTNSWLFLSFNAVSSVASMLSTSSHCLRSFERGVRKDLAGKVSSACDFWLIFTSWLFVTLLSRNRSHNCLCFAVNLASATYSSLWLAELKSETELGWAVSAWTCCSVYSNLSNYSWWSGAPSSYCCPVMVGSVTRAVWRRTCSLRSRLSSEVRSQLLSTYYATADRLSCIQIQMLFI